MSPNLESRWTTWGTVSSGFREIEIGWDTWGLLPHYRENSPLRPIPVG
jgi:hypothetical protein